MSENRVVAIIPCAGVARRMGPLSIFLPKFALPVLDETLLSATFRSLNGVKQLSEVVLVSRDQTTEKAIVSAIRGRPMNFPYTIVQGRPDFLGSLRLAINKTSADKFVILMPDVYFHTSLNLLPAMAGRPNESDVLMGVGFGRFDEETTHTDVFTRRGKLRDLVPRSERVEGLRSAGRYVFSRDALGVSLDAGNGMAKDAKVEDLLRASLARGCKIKTFFLGQFTNINTPQELLKVNLHTLRRTGQRLFIGRSKVIHSSIRSSVVSSGCVVERCTIKKSLILPRTSIRDISIKNTVAYGDGRVLVF